MIRHFCGESFSMNRRLSMKTRHIHRISKLWLALTTVLLLSLPTHGLGYDMWQPPPGQPAQMWSKFDYDPKLWDTFFESDVMGYPDRGHITTRGKKRKGEDSSLSEHTARCFSNSLGTKHLVEFCEARLVDANTIDLLIHHTSPGFHDRLRVQVRNGMFTCQFWNLYQIPGRADMVWTTKRQALTLDKELYRKGDVLKGRIDLECVMEATNPEFIEKKGRRTRTVKVYGVFKPIVE
jgi:hypothetical protein